MGTKVSGSYKGFKFNLEAKNALPAPITSLSATAIDFANVQLVFANVVNAISYQYSVNGGEWTALGGTKIVSGLTGDTAYAFRVRGVGVKGNGPESPVANATTLSQLPAQITDLTGNAPTSNTIVFSYTDAARATSHQYTLNNIDWFAVPGDKTLTGLIPATPYTIRVRGVNAAGNGVASAPLVLTTPATITYAGFSNATSDRTTAMNVVTNPYSPSTSTSGSWQVARALVGKTTGQSGYFEVLRGGSGSADMTVGIGGIATALNNYVGASTGSIGVYSNGVVNRDSANLGAPGLAFGGGDRIMVAYNGTKVWFGKNGTWPSGHDPVANTGGYTLPTGVTTFFPMLSFYLGNGAPTQGAAFNFGQSPFTYTPPAGFPAWTSSAYPTSFGPEIKGSRVTLSAQNLTMNTTGGWATALARSPRLTGRYYWESTLSTNVMQGFTVTNADLNQEIRSLGGFNIYPNDGTIRVGSTTLYTNSGGSFANGTKLGLAWDGAKVYVRLDGVWLDGSDPVAGTGGFAYAPGAPVYAAIAASGFPGTANFGQAAYQYTAPTGYENWTVAPAPDQVSNLTATALTATTVQLGFTSQTSTASYQYSINNGTNWFALDSNKIITGLTQNTAYTQILVRGMNEFTGLSTGPVSATTPVITNTTLSTTDKATTAVLSNGDTRLQSSTLNVWSGVRSVFPRTVGKWYTEVLFSGDAATRGGIGLGSASALLNDLPGTNGSIQYYSNGPIIRNGTTVASLANFNAGQRVMIATDGYKVWFGVNGVWVLSSNPATNVGGFAHPGNPNDPLYIFLSLNQTSGVVANGGMTANMGQSGWAYTIPTGFTAWRG